MTKQLLRLAATLREMEQQIASMELDDQAVAAALDSYRAQLLPLADDLEEYARRLSDLDLIVADRMNNFLMSVQTASDRLRSPADASVIREQLQWIVQEGKAGVAVIRRVLASE